LFTREETDFTKNGFNIQVSNVGFGFSLHQYDIALDDKE